MNPINKFRDYFNEVTSERVLPEAQSDETNPKVEKGIIPGPTCCFVTDLPLHITSRIFYFAFNEKCPIYSVSKAWASLKTNPDLYNELYSRVQPHIFNKVSFEQFWGDPGPEPKLPLSWLCDFDPQEGAITLVPEKITRIDTGKIQYFKLKNLEKWLASPLQGHPLKISELRYREIFKTPRLIEKSHWVWIHRKAIGKGNDPENFVIGYGGDYPNQENLAKLHGGKVAGLIDLTTSIAAKYVKTGNPFFISKPDEDDACTSIRVQDMVLQEHIGLIITDHDVTFVNSEYINSSILVARRSFGVDDNGKPVAPSGSMNPKLDHLSTDALKAMFKQARLDYIAVEAECIRVSTLVFEFAKFHSMKRDIGRKIIILVDILRQRIPEIDTKIQDLTYDKFRFSMTIGKLRFSDEWMLDNELKKLLDLCAES